MSESNYKSGGLDMGKYRIQKRIDTGFYVDCDPKAEYFVLRIDKDPHAKVAILVYADSVEKDNPEFAKDIRDKWK